jgi:hypothetical protein
VPFVSTVHADQALTAISQAYQQEDLVGDQVFPVVPVDKRSDLWFVYGREMFTLRGLKVRPGAVAPEMTYTLSKSSYNAERHAERHLVTDAERRVSDIPLQPEIDATEILTGNLMTNAENDQLSVANNTAVVTQNTTLSGTSQWSDYTNSTPLTNIRSGKVAVRLGVGREANTFLASFETAMTLADHPSIKDLIKYTHPEALTESGLPDTIRGMKVLVAKAISNTGDDAIPGSFQGVMGKNAVIAYVNPSPGLKTISFGWTFEAPDDTTGARGYSVRKYRDDAKTGDYVEAARTFVPVVVAANAAYLFVAATT